MCGTLKPSILKILWPKTAVFCSVPAFYDTSKTYDNMKFKKEVQMIIVVDLSLHSLSKIEWDITRERLRKRENERIKGKEKRWIYIFIEIYLYI